MSEHPPFFYLVLSALNVPCLILTGLGHELGWAAFAGFQVVLYFGMFLRDLAKWVRHD